MRLPLRKKFCAARSACCGRYTLPAFRRPINSSGVTSTRITSSAPSSTVSGTVSCTRMPVIAPTVPFRLSRCCTLSDDHTSMPAASSSCTSCQRFGWREPSTLECANSSTSSTAGRAPGRRRGRTPSACGHGGHLAQAAAAGRPAARRFRCGHGFRPGRPARRRQGFAHVAPRPAWRRSCPRRRWRRSRCAACRARRAVLRRAAFQAAGRGRGGCRWVGPRNASGWALQISTVSRRARHALQRQIEPQHIHARLAEHAPQRLLGVACHQRARPRADTARACHAATWYCAPPG
jgi:hypothetical protein